jgi:hypothetical protein
MAVPAPADLTMQSLCHLWAKYQTVAPSFDPAVAPGEHEGLLASLFRIVPADPHIR